MSTYDFTKNTPQPGTEEFSLMVWASTTELGCGVSAGHFVCFYCGGANPGNAVGYYADNVFPVGGKVAVVAGPSNQSCTQSGGARPACSNGSHCCGTGISSEDSLATEEVC